MSFTKINHYEKEYADTHHECALTVTEGVENQPVVNPYFVRKKKRALTTEEYVCLLYTSPSPRDRTRSRMPSSA